MIFKTKIPVFVPGKTKTITQKMFNALEMDQGHKIVPSGYNLKKIKEFGSFPLRLVNSATNGKVYKNQTTVFPNNVVLPAGSIYNNGVVFGKNTKIGFGSQLVGIKALGNIILTDSVTVKDSVFEGNVKASSRITIKGNCSFNRSFTSTLKTTISGMTTTFNGDVTIGDELKAHKVVFNNKVSIGNNALVDESYVNGELKSGIRSHFKNTIFDTAVLMFGAGNMITTNSIFETRINLKGVFLANSVMFSKEKNEFNKCRIGSGVNLPNYSTISNSTFNEFSKSSKPQRAHVGDFSQIFNSKINNADIGVNSYFSNSNISYCGIASPLLDLISVNTFENITIINNIADLNDTLDLSSVVFKGCNKSHSNIYITIEKDLDVSTLPFTDSEHVITIDGSGEYLISGFDKVNGRCDGQVVFDGTFVFDVVNMDILKSKAWFECSDDCQVKEMSVNVLENSNNNLQEPPLLTVVNNSLRTGGALDDSVFDGLNDMYQDTKQSINDMGSHVDTNTFDLSKHNVILSHNIIPDVHTVIPIDVGYKITVDELNSKLHKAADLTIPDEAEEILTHASPN
ncbi:MAG: hypothetical protein QM504_03440 [Pseudomonadota bacterium]